MQLDEYRRVSQVGGREGDRFLSPELQRRAIEDYARLHGHTARPNPEELDVSGGKLRRPILDKIMERIRNGESDGMIVFALDRYSRDVLGGNLLLLEIKEAGGTLVSVHENLDISTADGKMMFDFRMAIAENYLTRSRERWLEVQRNAVERGIYTEPYVPIGMEKREDRHLYLSPDAPIVREAFQMRIAREPTVRIVDFFNENLPRPNGGLWIARTVELIFERRIYRGELSRRGVTNTKACEPLVTEAEWQAAQITRKKSSPRTKSDHLLVGIIRCAGCRYVMTPNAGWVTKAGKTYRIPQYRCRRAHGAGRCPAPSTITRKSIDPYVEAAFRSEMAGTRFAAAQTDTDIERAQVQLAGLEAELTTFAADTTVREALGEAAYHAAVKSRADGVAAAREALRSLSTNTTTLAGVETWDSLSVDERRRVLGGAIDAVFIRRGSGADDRSLIVWAGDLEGDLPTNGRGNGPIRSYVW
ncbi:MAG TPA: recombinase family protein [Solirubrobacteraceae bacterium]|jgi:site-specific DNA recombinase|nr:recombinase family protein [Solirubrobacteraceae bacterium]